MMSMRQAARGVLCALATAAAAGCAAFAPVDNPGAAYMPEKADQAGHSGAVDTPWVGSLPSCAPLPAPAYGGPVLGPVLGSGHIAPRPAPALSRITLSRGDVVHLSMIDGEEFVGDYTLGPDGTVSIPFIGRIAAAGLTEEHLARHVENALVAKNLAPPELADVAIRIVHYGVFRVSLSGALFAPGLHPVNEPVGRDERDIAALQSGQARYGSSVARKTLTTALRVAAGVRPDADVSRVSLIRDGVSHVFDLTGVFTGADAPDPVLQEGDVVHVPSKRCFQRELVRPSAISPRGVRLYVSKAHFGADARYHEDLPYGMRLLNAAVVASCVGGPKASRAHRQIVLVSRNPLTGASEVVQRSVEDLLRNRDRDDYNPYLMPNDGVACYNAPLEEAADVSDAITSILEIPLLPLRAIAGGSN